MKPKLKNEIAELSDAVISILYGFRHCKKVDGRGLCGIMPMIFTWGLCYGIDKQENYEGRYCFHSLREAIDALVEWNGSGDPPGNWIKHKGTIKGEYKNPNYERLPNT